MELQRTTRSELNITEIAEAQRRVEHLDDPAVIARMYWKMTIVLEFILSTILLVDVSCNNPPSDILIMSVIITLLLWCIFSLTISFIKGGYTGTNLPLNLLVQFFTDFSRDSSMVKLIIFLCAFNWVRYCVPRPYRVSLISPATFAYCYWTLATLYLALFFGNFTDSGKTML